ncbi:MAG TPA: hypothetical protein PKY59_23050 [Pyrinomonadaceae bacterium]|nr:hypothetical protein [Pyrinomonadaceae bacterium]
MSVIFDDKILVPKSLKHLAFVACQHKKVFPLYDSANDREDSRFLEEISNFEAEILTAFFQIDVGTAERFGGWTGEMIITNENSEIIHHERHA